MLAAPLLLLLLLLLTPSPGAAQPPCAAGQFASGAACVACAASTYSLGGTATACASCPPTAAFVSSAQGCAPLLATTGAPDVGVAFALSGSQAEGVAAFATVAAQGGVSYTTGPFGGAATALALATGSYLSTPAFAAAPAGAPTGAGPISVSAWVQCSAPTAATPQMSVIEWGPPGPASSASKFGILATTLGPALTIPPTTPPIQVPICDGAWHHVALSAQCSGNLRSIPGLVMWFDSADASTIVLSGITVTSWLDKSGLGNNALPGGGGQPTYTASTPGIQFNAGSLSLPNGAFPYGDSGYSYFAVASFGSSNVMDITCAGTAAANQFFAVRGSSPTVNAIDAYWYGGTPSQDLTSPNFYTPGAPFMFETHYLGNLGSAANPTGLNSRWQSLNMAPPQYGTVLQPRIQPNTGNSIGGCNNLQGVVYELIVFSSSVTAAQQAQIEG